MGLSNHDRKVKRLNNIVDKIKGDDFRMLNPAVEVGAEIISASYDVLASREIVEDPSKYFTGKCGFRQSSILFERVEGNNGRSKYIGLVSRDAAVQLHLFLYQN